MDVYDIVNSDFDALWLAAYAGALPDLYLARKQVESSSQWGYWIQTQVLIAFNYHVLVDFYGTIPFSQAISEEFPSQNMMMGKKLTQVL